MFVDLDRLKGVNDTLGHAVGDALIVAVARRLHQTVRPDDTVARLGGDEFAVVAAARTEGELDRIGGRLSAALHAPFEVRERQVQLQVSVGRAAFPADALDADSLIRLADAAMYVQKPAEAQTPRSD
jgi:diguanylate cyclase (GGDEF)-like protein